MTNANDRWHSNVTIIIVLDWTKLHFDLDLSWQHFLHCRELIFEPYYFEIYLLFYLKVYNSKGWKCLIENVKIFLAKLIFFIKNELSKEKCPFSSSIFAIYFVRIVFHFLPLVKTKEKQSKVIERDTISHSILIHVWSSIREDPSETLSISFLLRSIKYHEPFLRDLVPRYRSNPRR